MKFRALVCYSPKDTRPINTASLTEIVHELPYKRQQSERGAHPLPPTPPSVYVLRHTITATVIAAVRPAGNAAAAERVTLHNPRKPAAAAAP